MRISTDENDSGYQTYIESGIYWDVFLNGEFVDQVFTADEERGMICKYKVPLEVVDDIIQSEIFYGKVEIKPKGNK